MGLHRAINDLLTGNEGNGIPRRTADQVVARINRRWYGENAEERSAAGYTPTDDAPGVQPIRNPSSWLAAAILAQDCSDLSCEDGEIIGNDGTPCPACRERHAEERAARQAAAELRARLEAESQAHAAARAAAEEWETARADEQRRAASALYVALALPRAWHETGYRAGWLETTAKRHGVTAWHDVPRATEPPDEPFGWIAPDVLEAAAADLARQEEEFEQSRVPPSARATGKAGHR